MWEGGVEVVVGTVVWFGGVCRFSGGVSGVCVYSKWCLSVVSG